MTKKIISLLVNVEVDDNSVSLADHASMVGSALRSTLPGMKPTVWTSGIGDFNCVRAFHQKFGVPVAESPSLLGGEMLDFRVKFMQEELDEFKEAIAAGDLLTAADSLVDLSYVTLGTADIMGLPWPLLWNEVQRANMSKERAVRVSDSKRGTTFDVIKPHGWTAPDHSVFLGGGPWGVFNPTAEPSAPAPSEQPAEAPIGDAVEKPAKTGAVEQEVQVEAGEVPVEGIAQGEA